MAQDKTETYSYRFKVDAPMFRKALYFNNFAMRRGQSILIMIAWVFAVIMIIWSLASGREVSNVTWMCYIVIAITVPLMVFSSEQGYRRYRSSVGADQMRDVIISPEWIKFKVEGQGGGDKVAWPKIVYAFELKDMFIIYRDSNLMVILPKAVVPQEDLPGLRAILQDNLGKSFHQRVKA